MSHVRSLQGLLLNNKKNRQRKIQSFTCLIQAIDQFNVDKKLDILVDQLVLTFESWYEEEIPEPEELAKDKKLQSQIRQKIEEFMMELEASSACGEKSLRPFWRNTLKTMLDLLFLPTQPSLWSRIKSFFTRS
jgi:hypothetical protein